METFPATGLITFWEGIPASHIHHFLCGQRRATRGTMSVNEGGSVSAIQGRGHHWSFAEPEAHGCLTKGKAWGREG